MPTDFPRPIGKLPGVCSDPDPSTAGWKQEERGPSQARAPSQPFLPGSLILPCPVSPSVTSGAPLQACLFCIPTSSFFSVLQPPSLPEAMLGVP